MTPLPRQRPGARPHNASPFYERWWFWTGMVLAATVGVGATYFGVRALRLSDEWKNARGLVEDPSDHLQRGKEARTAADIMIGTGAAVALATIIGAAIVGMDRPERPRRNRTRILPGCTGQGCSLTVTGRF